MQDSLLGTVVVHRLNTGLEAKEKSKLTLHITMSKLPIPFQKQMSVNSLSL